MAVVWCGVVAIERLAEEACKLSGDSVWSAGLVLSPRVVAMGLLLNRGFLLFSSPSPVHKSAGGEGGFTESK